MIATGEVKPIRVSLRSKIRSQTKVIQLTKTGSRKMLMYRKKCFPVISISVLVSNSVMLQLLINSESSQIGGKGKMSMVRTGSQCCR